MNACCPAFAQPCDACDEAEVRVLARAYAGLHSDGHRNPAWHRLTATWRRIASHAGIHPEDMRRFLTGKASLTPENRKQIRAHLRNADTAAQEPRSTTPSERVVVSGYAQRGPATEAARYVPRACDVPREGA